MNEVLEKLKNEVLEKLNSHVDDMRSREDEERRQIDEHRIKYETIMHERMLLQHTIGKLQEKE